MLPQQTIELAIDLRTDRRIEAGTLLEMSEEEFSALRRQVMKNRVDREKGAVPPILVCGICRKPLYLSRFIREVGNRWFEHDGSSPECPWYAYNKLSPDQRRALIYRGQQEGERHRSIKNFVADFLEREVGASNVERELVTFGQVLKGEWKRPDVQFVWKGMRIVFEIQLSYTFLSEVIKRDEFYRREGIFIIWLFDALDLRKSTVRDEAFFNRRNLFVMDQVAMDESRRVGRLMLTGVFQEPTLSENGIEEQWRSRLVSLDDIRYPTTNFRPYFFDYEEAKRALELQREAAERRRIEDERQAIILEVERRRHIEQAAWQNMVSRYLNAAIAYYDSDYEESRRTAILHIAEEMYDCGLWHRGFECLSDESFFGWHRVLPVLLSMKLDRPVGYSKYHSAYQVLEAAVRQTYAGKTNAYAVPYLWASYIYKITLNQKQKQWRERLAQDIKRVVEAGEKRYLRQTCYDEAIGLLFPELEEKLCSPFATQMYIAHQSEGRDRTMREGSSA